MAYVPTTWVEKVTKVGPTNMNHLELGVQATAAVADAALPVPAGSNGQFLKRVGGVWVPTSFAATDIPNYPTDATKVLKGDGSWAYPPGFLLVRDYITANVGPISATTEGTSVAVVSGSGFAYDGATEVKVEFWAPGIGVTTGTTVVTFVLFRGATALGQALFTQDVTGNVMPGPYIVFHETPPAAASQYTIKAFVGSNTLTVLAGAGGAGALMKAFLKVTKV